MYSFFWLVIRSVRYSFVVVSLSVHVNLGLWPRDS